MPEEAAKPANEECRTRDSKLVKLVHDAFSPGGLLSRKLSSFTPRESQRAFAEAVAETIETKGTLVAEAGTGTGKTFAYLVPALFAGIRVLVSTAGKPLQDQLYTKDLPLILRTLGLEAYTVQLRGRSNYICRKRLEEVDWLPTKEDIDFLRDIQIFAATSETGDRSELKHIPENDPIWPYVTSTKENCPGTKCPLFGECFLTKARREAKKADILVVNHHLFLSSLAMSDEGADEILPDMPLTVVDEAHQLSSIATNFFGDVLSTAAISDLCRDTQSLGKSKAQDGAQWDVITREADASAKDLALAVATKLGFAEGDRKSVEDIAELPSLMPEFSRLMSALGLIEDALAANSGRDTDLDMLLPRCERFEEQLDSWMHIAESGSGAASGPDNGNASEAAEDIENPPHVRWIQEGKTSVRFCDTPLSFAPQLKRIREEKGEAWVFTSATLSVAGDFSHFLSEIGLPDARTETWPSPFDYFNLASFYLPRDLPNPNSPEFPSRVAERAWPLVRKAEGRTLFLCTNLRSVDIIADRISELAMRDGTKLKILRQGDGTRKGLLEKFRSTPHTVLVGSMSFWEGIDIRGEALSVVVIDRIPFSPPDDPIVAARCNWIKSNGGHPFLDYQVPEAVTLLRQGAGRLIRSEEDRGVFMLCDSRVFTRWGTYGRSVVESLPDFCRTTDEARALSFIPDSPAPEQKHQARKRRRGRSPKVS